MSLRLNVDAAGERKNEFDEKSDEFQGKEVTVTFVLPDGTSHEGTKFRSGNDAQLLKVYVAKHFDIAFEKQTLWFNGEEMIDPWSLVDHGITSEAKVEVRAA